MIDSSVLWRGRLLPLCMALLLSLSIAACGGSGSSGTGAGGDDSGVNGDDGDIDNDSGDSGGNNDAPPPETTPPTVSGASPANGESHVARRGDYTFTFSEDMRADSIAGSSIFLRDSAAVNQAATVSYDSATRTATLAPVDRLAPLADYTLTVSTGVEDAAGNALASDYIVSFTTADRSWGSAGVIDRNETGFAAAPQQALAGDGSYFAAWQQDDTDPDITGTQFNIYVARYTSEAGWSEPQRVSTNSVDRAVFQPEIAADANGNAVVVWVQRRSTGSPSEIYASRYTAGAGWSEPVAIGDATSDRIQTLPHVASNADGEISVVWLLEWGINWASVYGNRYVPGEGWKTAAFIGASGGSDARAPRTAVDAAGNIMVAWDGGSPSRTSWRRYSGGSWNTAANIATEEGYWLDLAGNAVGDAIVCWRSISAGNNGDVVISRFDSDSATWSPVEFIDTENSTTCDIAINDSGEAIVAYSDTESGIRSVYAGNFIGNSWNTPVAIETSNDNTGGVSVDINSSGDGALAYLQEVGGTYRAFFSGFDRSGETWSEPLSVENLDLAISSTQACMNDEGDIHVIWWVTTSLAGVYGNQYD